MLGPWFSLNHIPIEYKSPIEKTITYDPTILLMRQTPTKNRHQKGMCVFTDIGLCAKDLLTIIGLVVNIIAMVTTTQHSTYLEWLTSIQLSKYSNLSHRHTCRFECPFSSAALSCPILLKHNIQSRRVTCISTHKQVLQVKNVVVSRG